MNGRLKYVLVLLSLIIFVVIKYWPFYFMETKEINTVITKREQDWAINGWATTIPVFKYSFEFEVNGVVYSDAFIKKINTDKLEEGSTIIIKYMVGNPDINELVQIPEPIIKSNWDIDD